MVVERDYEARGILEEMSNEELEWMGKLVDGEDILNLPIKKQLRALGNIPRTWKARKLQKAFERGFEQW